MEVAKKRTNVVPIIEVRFLRFKFMLLAFLFNGIGLVLGLVLVLVLVLD
jgi:hypothetical protein